MKPTVHDSRGLVRLGQELGRGGEGAVYDVAGAPNKVAKVYHKSIHPDKATKLRLMTSLGNEALLRFTAWPLDILRRPSGEPCGLIMPKITGHKEIHTLYSPKSRKAEFPDANWRFLVRTATNTARAFAAIHSTGCVIGDVNHGGVTVSDQALVRLIDCDSFQVKANGRQFLCEVGVGTFTPPELQGRPFRGIVRNPNHDAFGLAVLIFQLLFMGRHPFSGRYLGRGDMPIEQAIAEHRFAYGSRRSSLQMEPPPNAPTLAAVSRPVALLFERAFSREAAQNGDRPSPQEWITALEDLEKQIRVCPTSASHHFHADLNYCPWCRIEAATKVILFNVVIARPSSPPGKDLNSLWAQITAVAAPGLPPPLMQTSDFPHVIATPHARSLSGAGKWRNMACNVATFLAVAGVCYLSPEYFALWILAGLSVRCVFGDLSLTGEVIHYRDVLCDAEKRWTALHRRWVTEVSDEPFHEILRRLKRLRQSILNLEEHRKQRYQKLEQNRYQQQLQRYLERVYIEKANIPGIGAGRKATLRSFNIVTAADVTRTNIMRVPGFGPAITSKILAWRTKIEGGFRFDGRQGVDPQQLALLDREISTERQIYLNAMAAGLTELIQTRERILTARVSLKKQLDQIQAEVAQAEANFKAASN